MFNNPPKVFAHKSVLDAGNFVTPEFILNKNTDDRANLFHRFCPHRMYPMHTPGEIVQNVYCKFHGFEWAQDGTPLNNPKKLSCGNADIGRSGLVLKNFQEPNHHWVDDLAKETDLEYSHSFRGTSKGSWLWLMDAEADLLHVHKKGVHPFLSKQIDLETIVMEQGDGWVLQNHPTGWWLYIFPFTFVEYGNPGMLMVNYPIPHDINNEYGFDWITQFYYNKDVSVDRRFLFETAETVFKEDVATIELLKGGYFPLMKALNRYEDHGVHWGKWFKENKI